MRETKLTYTAEPVDLPREKLAQFGAETLTDQELVAVMLGSGCTGRPVQELAKDALQIVESNNFLKKGCPHPKGLGKAKLSLLLAAKELFRRRYSPRHYKVTGPQHVFDLLRFHAGKEQEHFWVITLNGANEVINIHTVSIGLVNRTMVHPREVFRRGIADNACSLVLAHNHPSGNVQPSTEDLEVTKRLVEAGTILGIPVLDHLIISAEAYLSLQQEGGMTKQN
jgi:DNA repair protein RadC